MEGGNLIQFYGEGAEPQTCPMLRRQRPYGEGWDDEHPGLPDGPHPLPFTVRGGDCYPEAQTHFCRNFVP